MTHPWRQYANRPKPNGEIKKSLKPLKMFLAEITETWSKQELAVRYNGRFDRYSFTQLPDKIIANWINHLLRRYIDVNSEEETFDEI